MSDLIEKCSEAICKVLNIPSINMSDDFRGLGLDSIRGLELCWELSDSLGVEVSLSEVLGCRNLEALVDALDGAGVNNTTVIPDETTAPLTPLQLDFLTLEGLTNQSVFVWDVFEIPLVSKPQLESAVATLSHIHPVLRTTFDQNALGYFQKIHAIGISKVSIKWIPNSTRSFARALDVAFDVTEGPMVRMYCAETTETILVLVIAHHLVFDGHSIAIFAEELSKICQGFEPATPMPFSAYCAQNGVGISSVPPKQSDEPKLETLDISNFDHLEIERPIDHRLIGKVRDRATSLAVTEFSIYCAAAFLTMFEISKKQKLIFGVATDIRHKSSVARSLGPYVAVLPIGIDLSVQTDNTALVMNIHDSHGHARETYRASGKRMLPKIGFTMEERPARSNLTNSVARKIQCSSPVGAELVFVVTRRGQDISLRLTARSASYDQPELKELALRYTSNLDDLLSNMNRSLKDARVLDSDELDISFDWDSSAHAPVSTIKPS